MIVEFRNDQPGYARWLREHHDGYVLAVAKRMIHTTNCYHIEPYDPPDDVTRALKVCSESKYELVRWLKNNRGEGAPVYCEKCS